MAAKQLTLITSQKELINIQYLLKVLKSRTSSINISRPLNGKYKGKILVTLNVDESDYNIFSERFTSAGIQLMENERVKEYSENQKELEGQNSVDKNLANPLSIKTLEDLYNFEKIANESEIIDASKNVIEENLSLINQVEEKLYVAAKNEIDKAYNESQIDDERYRKSLRMLLIIAEDETIQSLKNNELSNLAGEYAVESIYKFKKYPEDLLNLALNDNLTEHVNITAVVKAAKVIFNETKPMNIERFKEKSVFNKLETAYSKIGMDISKDDKEILQKFFHHIKLS